MTLTLYRVPDSGTYVDTDANKIEFEDNDKNAKSQLITYNIMIDRSQTQNPAPYLEETRKPDTGFRGMRYVIKALFIATDGDNPVDTSPPHDDIGKLSKWFRQSSDIRGAYKNGRFGIQNDRAPEFDVKPTNSSISSESGGLKLVGLDFSEQIEYGIRTAIITLEHSGATSTIGSGEDIRGSFGSFTAQRTPDGYVDLRWTFNPTPGNAPPDSYNILFTTDGGGLYTRPASSQRHVITSGISDGNTYEFTIKTVYNTGKRQGASATITFTLVAP